MTFVFLLLAIAVAVASVASAQALTRIADDLHALLKRGRNVPQRPE